MKLNPFTEDEQAVIAHELTWPDYVAQAAHWAEHYERQARRVGQLNRDWRKSFGEPDPAYTLATARAAWLAKAWGKVAAA